MFDRLFDVAYRAQQHELAGLDLVGLDGNPWDRRSRLHHVRLTFTDGTVMRLGASTYRGRHFGGLGLRPVPGLEL